MNLELSNSYLDFILQILLPILMATVSSGAIIHGVAQHYLTPQVEIMPAFRKGLSKLILLSVAWLLFMLILLIAGLLALILIGLPIFLFLLARLFFNFQAVVLEELEPGKRKLVEDFW